ncbi:hypothetical protein RRG08_026413 [Elysia crispata]|uniref:Uncharacterized protein n=1 Tax=Elysia crispata TaxID=231223 RepID=A0AAE0XN70_9GAST|nr:hypothetical protein RRG08_026413 [Elysia crispata]
MGRGPPQASPQHYPNMACHHGPRFWKLRWGQWEIELATYDGCDDIRLWNLEGWTPPRSARLGLSVSEISTPCLDSPAGKYGRFDVRSKISASRAGDHHRLDPSREDVPKTRANIARLTLSPGSGP